MNNTIKKDAVLVHVDSHLDDVPELVEDERYFMASSKEEIMNIGKFNRTEEDEENHTKNYELRMDNFIIPAFSRDTISDIIYVSDDSLEEIRMEDIFNAVHNTDNHYDNKSGNANDFTLKKLYEQILGKNKSISRYYTIEEYLSAIEGLAAGRSKILDLDIDYFNDSNSFSI